LVIFASGLFPLPNARRAAEAAVGDSGRNYAERRGSNPRAPVTAGPPTGIASAAKEIKRAPVRDPEPV